ncbi:MAG TPA: response regulator [Burkholderiaceae bacterium]|nr:response regulator [Burkholderiaceae bacterium]
MLENINQSPLPMTQQVLVPQRTLLYVEDNPANMALVGQLIARRGDLRFLTAIDGDLGLLMARSYLPAIILMDINLPGKNGYEVLKLLREDPATRHIPVIALSSNASVRDIEKGFKAGFLHYLTKPYKLDELSDALDAALSSNIKEHQVTRN